ncbi:DUF4179 domain-containing protein [Sporosarcina sp. YIM B06819]|uniref:DUF4179 domain-containing protein n=1 Tax=Sporosarcina sp. YIM B06819 TaxID=3081769 RepID=UPI00298BF7B2|nr:DUF4179 domain-containing protein [Sporosarcina sp. YIM B06819]
MECKHIQEQIIDYLDGILNDNERIRFDLHVNGCKQCKDELLKCEEIIKSLKIENESISIPHNFMDNVRQSVANTQKKKRKTFQRPAIVGIVAALIMTLFVGTAVATKSFTTFAEWWRDFGNKKNEQIENYVQHGLGDNVNIEAESNGVNITVTSVVADDVQTHIYYEIEDRNKENKYMVDFTNGIQIVNQDELVSLEKPINSHIGLYSDKSNVYKGRLGIAPLVASEGTITLKLDKIQKAIETDLGFSTPKDPINQMEGDWYFEIPVKKNSAIVHELNVETEIEGNPIYFDKLTIAPTITVLSYRYRTNKSDNRMNYLTIDSLESDGKHVYGSLIDFAGVGFSQSEDNGWGRSEATFESLYFDNPTGIKVHIGSAEFTIQEKADFPINISKAYPQTFDYLGTTISIDKVEVGQSTKIVMSEELNAHRAYETFRYSIFDKDNQRFSITSNLDGYFFDKNGTKYEGNEYFYRTNELEDAVFYSTEHHIELSRDGSEGELIPVRLEIYGYQTTVFYDSVVDISLEEIK